VIQVFISYRHVSPDQDLAGFLEGYLKSRGLDVFIDTQMALKFDERWKIVPSQPVETVKNER
jgi:hypothetical protein